MSGLSILATLPRGAAIRVPARPARRLRLPPDLPRAVGRPRGGRRWTSGVALAGSTLFHTGVLAALLQVAGTGPLAARPYFEEEFPVDLVSWMREEPKRFFPPPVVEPPPLPEPPQTPVENLPPPAPTNPPPVELVAAAHPAVVVPEPPPTIEPAPELAPHPAAIERPASDLPAPAALPPDTLQGGPAPTPPVATTTDPDGGDGSAGWTTVREAILRRLAYPDSARRRGEEGRVLLELRVAADGSIDALEGRGESASDRLVHAAVSAARRAAPFEGAGPAEFRIPVVFRLTPRADRAP